MRWASAVISGARRFSHYKVKAQQKVHGTKSPGVELGTLRRRARLVLHRSMRARKRTSPRKVTRWRDAQIPVQTKVERRGAQSWHAALPSSRGPGGKHGRRADGDATRGVTGEIQRHARQIGARDRARWRQSDGSLWRLNRIPFLSFDMELLIAGVNYQLNAHRGRHTELTVGPVDGY